MNELLATIRIAGRALARNKLRSALTSLGIIIGVGAVIAMVALGQGAQEQVQKQIAALGSNMLFVGAGTMNRGGIRLGWGNTQTLVLDDVRAIERECPAVALAAPGTQTNAQLVFGNDNWGTRVTGTEPQYFDVREWPLQEGVTFTQEDVQSSANVAVIGETVRKNLFGATPPVGQTIRANNMPFKVVGVLTPKGQSATMGDDQDDVMIVPITTLQKKMTGQSWLRYINVSAKSKEASYAAQQQIEALLHDRHKIPAGRDNDFFVRNLADLAEVADQTGRVMTLLLASVAGVSLLVGGIGIMNIMLVSVTERTREIGIRMAIGATEEDVQRQFLIEAIVLGVVGGVIGVFLGVATSFLLRALGWSASISIIAMAIAVLFSMAVGVFFGYYPARKAAGLNPIQALRYE
ncbi:MAG TPA: ABC transporter permease [Candidatus Angelobacter sp.]|nr:ABC transporter permease [Candidatus Angelobacter sp.]